MDTPEQLHQILQRPDPLAELLAHREAELTRQLAQQLAQQEHRPDEGDGQQARQELIEALRERLDLLASELSAAHTLLDDLAAALGACPGCCGTEPTCRLCRGRGGTGFTAPDPDGFERLVVPAVRTYVRLRRPRTEHQPIPEGGAS
jgi:hypothetical protein